MAYYPERHVSRAAAWSRRFASFSAVLFLTAAIGHHLAWLETGGFFVVLGLVAAIAIIALLLAARGFSELWNRGDVGGRNLAAAVLISLVVLAPFGLALYRGLSYPMLHDVSTDLDDPPAFVAAVRARTPDMNPIEPFTPEHKALQLEKYPLVTGRRYDMPFSRVLETVDKVLAGRGWRIVSPKQDGEEDGEITIEAEASTTLLALPVDVAVRVTDEETTTYVDMRSASRYGEHDLGDNAARITDFLAELDGEVSALAGVLPAEPADAAPDEVEPPQPEFRPEG